MVADSIHPAMVDDSAALAGEGSPASEGADPVRLAVVMASEEEQEVALEYRTAALSGTFRPAGT